VYVTGVKPRGMYIMLTDGTRIDFREQGFTDKLFVCENFPDEDMFTLSVGYKHANITLKKADTEKYADIEWPTSNGITLTALPLSDDRNIFAVRSAYDPQLYVDIFGEELARSVKYSYPSASKITFTDKDGNEYFVDSGGSSEYSKSDERYTSDTRIIYADTGDNVGTEITKLTVGAFDERIDFGYINDKTPPLTAEVPLPGNGETIECEIPIITIDGDSYTITSVTRDDSAGNGHYLSFGMRIDDGSSKYDIRIYSLHLAPTDPELKKHFSSWGSSRNTEESDMYLGIGGVKKKNLTEYINTLEGRETITLGVYGLHAEMRGSWTIDFTEHKAAE